MCQTILQTKLQMMFGAKFKILCHKKIEFHTKKMQQFIIYAQNMFTINIEMEETLTNKNYGKW